MSFEMDETAPIQPVIREVPDSSGPVLALYGVGVTAGILGLLVSPTVAVIVVGAIVAVTIMTSDRYAPARSVAAGVALFALAPDAPVLAHISSFDIVPRTMALLLLLCGTIWLWTRRSRQMGGLPSRGLWLLFFGVVAVGGVANGRPQAIAEFFLLVYLPFASAALIARDSTRAVVAVRALTLAATVLATAAVAEFVTGRPLLPASSSNVDVITRAGHLRAFVGWTHPLALGMFLCLTGFLLVDSARRRGALLGLGAALLVVLGIVATEERSALLGLAAGIIVYVLMQSTRRQRVVVGAVVTGLLVLLLLVPGSTPNAIRGFLGGSITSGNVAGADVAGRVELFRLARHAIATSPVYGYGYGANSKTLASTQLANQLLLGQNVYTDVADLPLAFGIGTGILGMGCFVLIVGASLRDVIRRRSRPGSAIPAAGLAAGITGGFVASLGTSATSSAMFLLFVCGIAASQFRKGPLLPSDAEVAARAAGAESVDGVPVA